MNGTGRGLRVLAAEAVTMPAMEGPGAHADEHGARAGPGRARERRHARVPERAAAIGPPLAGVSETVREAVRGVTPDVLTILDIDALLSDPRLVVKERPT